MPPRIKERPFNAYPHEVRNILAGRQTQLRRVIQWKPLEEGLNLSFSGLQAGPYCTGVPESGYVLYSRDGRGTWNQRTKREFCRYGQSGERLWARETFYIDILGYSEREQLPSPRPGEIEDLNIYYRADGECCQQIPECVCAEVGKPKWRPSIFMPRWASRINLGIVSIRAERVQEITEEDAHAEGVQMAWEGREQGRRAQLENSSYRAGFHIGWDSLNKKRGFGWDTNCWVWVIEFRKIAL